MRRLFDNYIRGTKNDDTLNGSNLKDEIVGLDGNDTINAKAGDDWVYGDDGEDIINGGAGNDKLWGNDDNDRVRGGSGHDEVYGDDGNDTLYGDNGNDEVYGGQGKDEAHGGKGDDYVWGNEGDDKVYGNDGNDEVYGDDGNDEVHGDKGNDGLYGGHGDDLVMGGAGDDYAWGNEGDDIVHGGSGHDGLYGDDGNDKLYGETGNDWALGGKGNDEVYGGDGNDYVWGNGGNDYVDGGDGNDEVYGDDGNDTVLGGAGNDWVLGGDGHDIADGGAGSDDVHTGDGDDQLMYSLAENAGQTDHYDGGKGCDRLCLSFTSDEWSQADIRADVAAFLAYLRDDAGKGDDDGFDFTAFNLSVYNIEKVKVLVDGTEIDLSNQAPGAVNDEATTDEDTQIVIDVLANDSDPDDQGLNILEANVDPAQGFVAIEDGKIVFNPAANFNGEASIAYTIQDADGQTDSATVSVTVNPVNDAPNAVKDQASTDKGEPVTIDVLANDTDPDGDALTIVKANVKKAQGSVEIVDGKLVFTPADDFTGTATIKYVVKDAGGLKDKANVKVQVKTVNDAPVAMDDTATTDENTKVVIDVLANDTDPDGDTLTIINPMVDAVQGTAIVEDGKIVFTPAADFSGEASIAYSVQDAGGLTDSATVTVTVNSVNDAPVAVDDTATTDEDTKVVIDVLANDSDPDGDDLTIINPMVDAAQGTVIVEDGKIVFTPAADFSGEANIAYTVQDAGGLTDSATVTVTVNPVNDAPVAVDDTATTDEDTKVIIDVLANDSDPDGDDLTIINPMVDAAQGTVIVEDGKIVFTPAADFNGEASIAYTVQDTDGLTDSATVKVTINPVNDAPDAVKDKVSTNENTQIIIDVLANDTDPDGDDLTIIEANVNEAKGSVEIVEGKIVFTPSANFSGKANIAYSVQDAGGLTDSATVRVKVKAVNDAPVAVDDTATTDENAKVIIDVLANDSDPDGDALTIVNPMVDAAQGTAIVEDGKIVFTPAADFSGEASIAYTVQDADGLTDSATVTVTVNPVNDAPDAVDDTATTDEDTKVVIDVLANDTDPDGDDLTIINPIVDAAQGTVIVEDGKIVFTPAADFSGEASIAYTVQDADGLTDSATVTVTVNPVNDAPDAVDDTATTDEDT
ncbi:MAG: Ig-like domain-containing protein, partial [Cohaesibacter sp.]|nr:Ig-like domain-containing protein [Cohaesibacter sp.]